MIIYFLLLGTKTLYYDCLFTECRWGKELFTILVVALPLELLTHCLIVINFLQRHPTLWCGISLTWSVTRTTFITTTSHLRIESRTSELIFVLHVLSSPISAWKWVFSTIYVCHWIMRVLMMEVTLTHILLVVHSYIGKAHFWVRALRTYKF